MEFWTRGRLRVTFRRIRRFLLLLFWRHLLYQKALEERRRRLSLPRMLECWNKAPKGLLRWRGEGRIRGWKIQAHVLILWGTNWTWFGLLVHQIAIYIFLYDVTRLPNRPWGKQVVILCNPSIYFKMANSLNQNDLHNNLVRLQSRDTSLTLHSISQHNHATSLSFGRRDMSSQLFYGNNSEDIWWYKHHTRVLCQRTIHIWYDTFNYETIYHTFGSRQTTRFIPSIALIHEMVCYSAPPIFANLFCLFVGI